MSNTCIVMLVRLVRTLTEGSVFSQDTEDGPSVATAEEVLQEAVAFLEETLGPGWRDMGGELPDPWLFLEHAGVKIWRAGKDGRWVDGHFTPDPGWVNIREPYGPHFDVDALVEVLATAGLAPREEVDPSDEERVKALMVKAINAGLLTQEGLVRG